MRYGQMLAGIVNFYLVGFVIYVAAQVTAAMTDWSKFEVAFAFVMLVLALIAGTRIVWLLCGAEPRGDARDDFDGIDESLRG